VLLTIELLADFHVNESTILAHQLLFIHFIFFFVVVDGELRLAVDVATEEGTITL